MKICFVSREFVDSKRAGGIATYIYLLAKNLVKNNHEVYVLSASDNPFKNMEYVYDGINVIKISGADFSVCNKLSSKYRSFVYFNRYRKKIANTLIDLNKKVGLDIVEFGEFGNEAKYCVSILNIPIVIRFHGPSGHDRTKNVINLKNSTKSELETAMSFHGLTFCSLAIKNLIKNNQYYANLLKNYKGLQSVIYNGVELRKNIDIKINEDKFIFTAGSFVKEKGFADLIEAVKIINNNNNRFNLIIAGKLGSLGEHYKNLSVSDEKYKEWLKVLGPIQRSELFSYYKHSILNVFPSHFEPFGLTCIEAMSVGGLVLGSSSGGMSEIIEDGHSGFIVLPNDVKILKNKILEILNLDNKVQKDIRLKSIERIENLFDLNITSKQTIDFYKKIINAN